MLFAVFIVIFSRLTSLRLKRSLTYLLTRSLLTKQFSPIKAKIFSIAIFTSVQEFKVNGYLRKSILGNFFLYLEKIEIMAEEVDQTKHQFVKRRHEEDEKPWRN